MERTASGSSNAKEDFDVLSNVSTKILPSLFKLVESLNQSSLSNKSSSAGGDDEAAMEIETASSSKDAQSKNQQSTQLVEAVTDAIGQLAKICPREFLQNLFKRLRV